MDRIRRLLRVRVWTAILFGLLVLFLSTSGALAASGCQAVSGKLTLQPVPAAECSSPVGICATGTYKGNLSGTTAGQATSLVSTVDTPTTGVILFTTDTVLTTKGGSLMIKNAVTYRTTSGPGISYAFSELDVIIGGTGEWAGASGTIQAAGQYDPSSGGDGVYSGVVCKP